MNSRSVVLLRLSGFSKGFFPVNRILASVIWRCPCKRPANDKVEFNEPNNTTSFQYLGWYSIEWPVAEWLDHLTCVQKGPAFMTSSRSVTKCEVRIYQLAVVPCKKAKGITRCGHNEKKEQGGTPQLIRLFSGTCALHTAALVEPSSIG